MVPSTQIICICNDRNDQKVRSLANHCLDLRFRRPSPGEVTAALRRVVKDEGYNIEDATLNRIAQSCNADIRQMLNLLQMWRPKGSQQLSAGDVSKKLETSFKDIDVGPFDVADRFFKEPKSSLDSRLRHYFVDSGLTPLLVQVCSQCNADSPQLLKKAHSVHYPDFVPATSCARRFFFVVCRRKAT